LLGRPSAAPGGDRRAAGSQQPWRRQAPQTDRSGGCRTDGADKRHGGRDEVITAVVAGISGTGGVGRRGQKRGWGCDDTSQVAADVKRTTASSLGEDPVEDGAQSSSPVEQRQMTKPTAKHNAYSFLQEQPSRTQAVGWVSRVAPVGPLLEDRDYAHRLECHTGFSTDRREDCVCTNASVHKHKQLKENQRARQNGP